MQITTTLTIADDDTNPLLTLEQSGSTPQAIAFRCTIVRYRQEGMTQAAIAQKLATTRPTVLLWEKRYQEHGIEGLLHIKEGRGRKVTYTKKKIAAIIHDTLHTTPTDGDVWTSRELGNKHRVSYDFVQKVWQAHHLKPWLVKTFKLSNDRHFVEKLRDVVGLYMNPPEHAVVFCLDEKTSIQALERTQQSLPLAKGRIRTITHDYIRHGTTTLFAALDYLKGKVIGACQKRHRHEEFIAFLNKIDQAVSKDLDIHCILDNYGSHKHQEVQAWLREHPRFHFHFIPTSSSWLNLVERWFWEITRKRIRRGSFKSVADLIHTIEEYVKENNAHPQPFIWTKKADDIFQKVNICKANFLS
jgi:transposase